MFLKDMQPLAFGFKEPCNEQDCDPLSSSRGLRFDAWL
jgi:hypothetical protein